jgi:hypothetical protein
MSKTQIQPQFSIKEMETIMQNNSKLEKDILELFASKY